MLQITAIGLISVGVVYVLLLGEIDLSVGAVSGLAAAVMAVLNVKHGWNPYLAIAAGVAVGLAIGLLQGSLFSRFGVPSFVVTLAGLLAWQGALLQVLGDTGTINITDPQDHRPRQHVLLRRGRLDHRRGRDRAPTRRSLCSAYRRRVAAGLADGEPRRGR